MQEWRQRRQEAGAERSAEEAGTGTADGGSRRARAKVYVYELPEGLNSECEELMSQWNWMLDMGLEEWPPPMLGDLANFAFALEPVVHAVLLQSRTRTMDPSEADWFYIPFYSGCSWRQSRYVEHVAAGWSQHDERLRVLHTWLATADIPSRYFGRKPHAVTVGGGNEYEAVGPALFERAIIFTLDVNACADSEGSLEGAAATEGNMNVNVTRSCFRSSCALSETVTSEMVEAKAAGDTLWCPRASVHADVAVSACMHVCTNKQGHPVLRGACPVRPHALLRQADIN